MPMPYGDWLRIPNSGCPTHGVGQWHLTADPWAQCACEFQHVDGRTTDVHGANRALRDTQ